MADIMRWQTLSCPCGSTQFYEAFALKRHPQGGLAKEGQAYKCAGCHQTADTAAMLRTIQIQRQRAQLLALEQELAGETMDEAIMPPPIPVSGTSRPA